MWAISAKRPSSVTPAPGKSTTSRLSITSPISAATLKSVHGESPPPVIQEKMEVTAFENPDSTIAVILLNRTTEELPATLRLEGELFYVPCPPCSISTIVIKP